MSTNAIDDPKDTDPSTDPEQTRLTNDGLERQATLGEATDGHELPAAVPASHLAAPESENAPIVPVDPADCPECDRLSCWAHARRGLAPYRVEFTTRSEAIDRGDGPATDGGQLVDADERDTPHPSDFTLFQIDILRVLASADNYGLGIKDALEDYRGEVVNHGRLYPNLDALVGAGLVEKGERDRRTNDYQITATGEALLAQRVDWLAAPFDGGDSA